MRDTVSLDITKDNQDLEQAVKILEFQSLTATITNTIGKPVEWGLKIMPAPIMNKMGDITEKCLIAAFKVVLLTINRDKPFKKSQNALHKGLVAVTGAAGGFLGGATLAIELPLSTAVMMRSIADIARERGEDLGNVEACLECIAVLGMDPASGDRSKKDYSEYFTARAAMAKEITKAAEYIASNGISEGGVPVVVKLLQKVAERFGVQLTDKIALEFIPIVGAVTGGSINVLFMTHFQRIATGHFTIRNLNRKYGEERVRLEYMGIMQKLKQTSGIYLDEVAATVED